MRHVRLQRHKLLRQGLVKVNLSRGDQVTRRDSAIVVKLPVVVDLHVNVDGTLDVETGDDGLDLHQAVAVGGPHCAQPGRVVGVQVSHALVKVRDVQLGQQRLERGVGAQAGEAGVGARGVAVPEAHEHALEGLAGRHVEDAEVQPEGDADLVLGRILSQGLRAGPDVGAGGHIRREYTCVVLEGFD